MDGNKTRFAEPNSQLASKFSSLARSLSSLPVPTLPRL